MKRVHKLFEPDDGRLVSSTLLWVNCGEQVELFSTGWDCDATEKIDTYYVFNMSADPDCDPILADLYKETCEDDCNTRIDRSKVQLTKKHTSDIIDQSGVYFLSRTCGAEGVTVWYKKTKVRCNK